MHKRRCLPSCVICEVGHGHLIVVYPEISKRIHLLFTLVKAEFNLSEDFLVLAAVL